MVKTNKVVRDFRIFNFEIQNWEPRKPSKNFLFHEQVVDTSNLVKDVHDIIGTSKVACLASFFWRI